MQTLKQPAWLKKTIHNNLNIGATRAILKGLNLNTVCQEARCPNIFDCFANRVATFLILGDACTRDCGFCSVLKGKPASVDEDEPKRLAEAVSMLGLKHVVITSVTRDDLPDGGSGQFAKTIRAVKEEAPESAVIEVLTPDFNGNEADIKRVIEAGPHIFGHNMETAPRLYNSARRFSDYKRSLRVLQFAKMVNPNIVTKSAIMLGLGETKDEITQVMKDLRGANCDSLAVGQYLRPSSGQIPVVEYINPAGFEALKYIGYSLGFKNVESGSFVRSSYRKGG